MHPTSIRLNPELYNQIKQMAANEKRSLSSQIIVMLQNATKAAADSR